MGARRTMATSVQNADSDSSDSEGDDSVAEDNPEEYLDPLAEGLSDEDEDVPAAGGAAESIWEEIVLEPLRVTNS